MITKATFIIECDNCSEEIEIDGVRATWMHGHYEPNWDADTTCARAAVKTRTDDNPPRPAQSSLGSRRDLRLA